MKTFLKVFAIIFIPLTATSYYVYNFTGRTLVDSARKEQLAELKSKWFLLSNVLLENGSSTWNSKLMRRLAQETNLRITLMKADGEVVGETALEPEEVSNMANHKNRPEVRQALALGFGSSIRYSNTVKQELYYFAGKTQDDLVLRISYPTAYTATVRKEVDRQIFSVFAFLFVVTLLVATYLARRISLPVQKMNYIAEKIEAGETDIHFPQFFDPTMSKVAALIYRIYHAMMQERQQAEHEREKLDHVYHTLEEGIILLDEENHILHFNQPAEKALGVTLTRGTNLLRDMTDFEVVDFFDEILASKQSRIWEKQPYKTKLFEVNLKILPQEKLLVFFDITDKAEYQNFKSELIGNISHELRTPLSMILGYAETILDDPEMAAATRNRFLQKIFNNSKLLNNIIDDLLELHRLERMGSDFEILSPANIEEIVHELHERFSVDGKHRFVTNLKVTKINVHSMHVMSILSNLIENAVKYSRGENLYISTSNQGREITIVVEDEGPTIPLSERDRIFERFYTISRSRNSTKSGTGLGLPIVKHIAQIYQGGVTITDGSNGGNRFTVHLRERNLRVEET